jgi:rare lipoprotein A
MNMKIYATHFPRVLGMVMALTAFSVQAAQMERPKSTQVLHSQAGRATYYGPGFHGRKTASGEQFNQKALVAAHPSWPLGTVARVTNLKNGKSARVRIIDRGPAEWIQRRGVIIDLSLGTAQVLGFIKDGKVPVRIDVLRWG